MILTPELIEAWKWELTAQAYKCRYDCATEEMMKKAAILDGVYTALTCLERAMSGTPSPNPLSARPKQEDVK